MLHLLDNGIVIFECSQGQFATNAWPLFVSSPPQSGSLHKFASIKRLVDLEHEFRKRSPENRDLLLTYWHDFLVNIGNRKLTCKTDNLTALSGIAERMQMRSEGTYLFGLWKEDLPRGLLWESVHLDSCPGPHLRFPHYQAPTWSWASVNGSTQIIGDLQNELSGEIKSLKNFDGGRKPLIATASITIAKIEGPKSALSESSVLELRGILKRYRCKGLDGRTKTIRNLDIDANKTEPIAGGTITFDVSSEARECQFWFLPLFGRHESGFGIGLHEVGAGEDWEKQVDAQVDEEEQDETAVPTFRRIGLVRLMLRGQKGDRLRQESKSIRII